MNGRGSRFGEDLLGAGFVDAVDRSGADEGPVVVDGVDTAAGARAAGGDDAGPVDDEARSVLASGSLVDGAGDDPFDVVPSFDIGGGDDDGSRVLLAERVDPVDGVGAGQALPGLPGGQVTRESAGVEHEPEQGDPDGPTQPLHAAESTGDLAVASDELFTIPRWLKVLGGLFALFIAAAIAFAVFEPIQVLPRIRLGPGYAMVGHDGSTFTSETVRGSVTLYTFVPLECGEQCDTIDQTMRDVRSGVASDVDLGDTDFRLVTISLEPVTESADLAAAAERAGADGNSWTWIGGDEAALRTVVGAGFRRFYEPQDDGAIRFDPGFVLVDGGGIVRGEYRYQTLADDSDKLIRHIDILADELRYADGATAVAYEAAHLFLCYP